MGDAGGFEGPEFVAEVTVAGDVLVTEAEDGDVSCSGGSVCVAIGGFDEFVCG